MSRRPRRSPYLESRCYDVGPSLGQTGPQTAETPDPRRAPIDIAERPLKRCRYAVAPCAGLALPPSAVPGSGTTLGLPCPVSHPPTSAPSDFSSGTFIDRFAHGRHHTGARLGRRGAARLSPLFTRSERPRTVVADPRPRGPSLRIEPCRLWHLSREHA
jgi:hypothetical protein